MKISRLSPSRFLATASRNPLGVFRHAPDVADLALERLRLLPLGLLAQHRGLLLEFRLELDDLLLLA